MRTGLLLLLEGGDAAGDGQTTEGGHRSHPHRQLLDGHRVRREGTCEESVVGAGGRDGSEWVCGGEVSGSEGVPPGRQWLL